MKVTITTDTNPQAWGSAETDEDICLRAAELLANECAELVKFEYPGATVETVCRYHAVGEQVKFVVITDGAWEIDHDLSRAVEALIEDLSPEMLQEAILEIDGGPCIPAEPVRGQHDGLARLGPNLPNWQS